MSTNPRPPCKICWRDKKKFAPAKFLIESESSTAFILACAACRKGYNCDRDKPLTVYRLDLDKRVKVYRNGENGFVKDFWTVQEAEAWLERRKKHGDKGVAAGEYGIDAPDDREAL
jgi:hypothetical protein